MDADAPHERTNLVVLVVRGEVAASQLPGTGVESGVKGGYTEHLMQQHPNLIMYITCIGSQGSCTERKGLGVGCANAKLAEPAGSGQYGSCLSLAI